MLLRFYEGEDGWSEDHPASRIVEAISQHQGYEVEIYDPEHDFLWVALYQRGNQIWVSSWENPDWRMSAMIAGVDTHIECLPKHKVVAYAVKDMDVLVVLRRQ